MKTAFLLLCLCVCTATVLAADAPPPPPPPCWGPLVNATIRQAALKKDAAKDFLPISDSNTMFSLLVRVGASAGGPGAIAVDFAAEAALAAQFSTNTKFLTGYNLVTFRQAAPVLLQCAAGALNRTRQQQDNQLNQLSDCAQLVIASYGRNVERRSEMRDFVSFIERQLSGGVSADAYVAAISEYFIRLFANVNFNDTGSIIRIDPAAGANFQERLRLCDVLVKPSVPSEYTDCVRRGVEASRVSTGGASLDSVVSQVKIAFDSDVEFRQRSGLRYNLTASLIASLNATLPQLEPTWVIQILKCIHDVNQPVPQPPSQTGIPGSADHPDADPICFINCPNNLICVGNLCVPPRPKCDGCSSSPSSGSDRFCFVSVNVTLLAKFNAYASAATRARLSGSTFQRPLDTELGFTYGVDITAQGEYRGVCVARVPPLPQCANVTNPVPCAPGEICTREGCRKCDLCAGNGRPGDNGTRIPDDVSDRLVRAGVDLSGFVRVDDRVNNTREGREVQTVQGAFQQIGADVRNLIELVFQAGQDGVNTSQQTAVQLARGSQITIDRIIQTIPAAPVAVVVDGNASFNANRVELRQDTSFAILLSGRDSQGRCNGNASINGALTIQGSSDISDNTTITGAGSGQVQTGGSWNFPPRRQDVVAGPNAVVNVAGAVALAGDISNATLNVIAIATARAVCVVANGARFATAGRVLGDTGLIYVRGAFIIQTTLVQPELRIEAGGNVTVDAGDIRTGFLGGVLNISSDGQLNLRSNGNSTNFTTFAECAATATLVVTVDSIAAVRRPGARGILFRFSAIGTLGIKYACRIRLIDSQNITLDLINPNRQSSSRRLLADGETQAVFSDGAVSFATADNSTSTSGGGTGTTTDTPTTNPSSGTNTNTTAPTGNPGNNNTTTSPTSTPTPTNNPTASSSSSSSSTGGGKPANTATVTATATQITAVVATITAVLMTAF